VAPLDLQEELSEGFASPIDGRCSCAPATLRLRSDQGELVRLRGKSVNFCAYCARLAAIENSEMLALDALEGDAPQVWLVLTTRTATVDMSEFYEALADVVRMLRKEPLRDGDGVVVKDGRKVVRRWPDVEYANCLEYSTGYGTHSGGERRPHWNLLLKGVPGDQAADVEQVAAAVWCAHVDAEPAGQRATSVYEGGGLTRYLALHFQKESQLPPLEFRGQRFNCSRGYFTGCTRRVARLRAKDSLAMKRALWRAVNSPEVQAIKQVAELTGDSEDLETAAKTAQWLAEYEITTAAKTQWIFAGPSGEPRGQLFKPAVGRIHETSDGHAYRPKVLPERHWSDITDPQRRALWRAQANAVRREQGGALILGRDGNPLPLAEPSSTRGLFGPAGHVLCGSCQLTGRRRQHRGAPTDSPQHPSTNPHAATLNGR
jgi:hypothetical protein